MSSTKEDGTAVAGEQLGSMSEPENNEDADTNGTPTKFCSACEKESDTLMKCRDCKCVWYCDAACQKRHWKEHKKECKPIKKELAKRGGKLDLGTEEDIGPLGKLPPREECPICMRALPLHETLQLYMVCCGKNICCGCDFQHTMKSEGARACAFCRTAEPESDEEILVRLGKRVERKDPTALHNLACAHGYGRFGLPVDQAKCIDILRQSAGLGCAVAQYQLGQYHITGDMGLEQNEEVVLSHWKEAAEGGDVLARHNLGCAEGSNGNHAAAIRHWRLSASGGYRISMDTLIIVCFEKGWLRHADLAETLQAMYRARAELRSEDRDEYIAHLKWTGKYKAEYEC